jgi:DnaJ homolog subfamily C member 19
MLWLLIGTVVLLVVLMGLRAFERASAASILTLLKWIAAFAGVALMGLMLISGRGLQALAGLVLVGPALWRAFQQARGQWRMPPGAGPGGATGPPPRQSGSMTRAEAYEVLGLKPGASAEEIHAAHRRLMRAAHPDAGGSDWLASRVNQARDVLLG